MAKSVVLTIAPVFQSTLVWVDGTPILAVKDAKGNQRLMVLAKKSLLKGDTVSFVEPDTGFKVEVNPWLYDGLGPFCLSQAKALRAVTAKPEPQLTLKVGYRPSWDEYKRNRIWAAQKLQAA